METLKKLAIGLLLGAAITFALPAATFTSQSFLASGITSIALTNTISVTNLDSGTIRSNVAGTIWTNTSGTMTVVTNNGSSTQTKNLLRDASLWVAADGQPILNPVSDAAGIVTNSSMASFYIKLIGQSGANAAVTFIFVPLPDGVNESTVAGDAFSISVTATTTTAVDKTVWLPSWKWPGVGKVRLKSMTNADTDATSRVDVLECSLNGFIP